MSDLLMLRYGSWAEEILALPPEKRLAKLGYNYKLAEQLQRIIDTGTNAELQAFSEMMEKRSK